MHEGSVSFASAEAKPVQLEGVLHIPDGGDSPLPGVVLCHPHSLHGGSMQVPVIETTARELALRGMIALRFNFRGVGRSEGSFGDGVAEVADVKGAVDFLQSRGDVAASRLYLMGYSFGASVGLRCVEGGAPISAMAALCLPLGESTILPLEENFWRKWAKPKLFLAGDRDPICPLSELQPLVELLPEPKQLMVLHGADHFLWGREQEVAVHIAEYLGGLY
ncbi:MAG TPA: alpha/beta family hydrolase [Anaerolineae bacterium]|nr:alpha/beta family hydrolase [Anaerolineae bacterium]